MPKIAFVDTNVYLHYQPFDQIDWRDMLEVDAVTIVVPPVVVRELNKHKEVHPRPQVRRRAAAVLKKLTAVLEPGTGAGLREGTDVVIEDRDPTIDFAAHQLSREIQDDHLIASIIMWKAERPEDDIVLVTSDTGLTLLTKAKRQVIATVGLPENLKLPDEPDPRDRQLRELQHELRELKLKTPRLSLAFHDGSDHITFVLPRPLELTQAELESQLEDIKQRYPRMGEGPKPVPRVASELLESMSALGAMALSLGAVRPEDIAKYNSELDDFYAAHVEYFKRELSFRNLERRTVKLEILLVNDGTAPAEDIDIMMLFPNGFELTTEPDWLEPPDPPLPPSKPRTPLERMAEPTWPLSDVLPSYLDPYNLASMVQPRNVAPPNVSRPKIRRTHSYEVELHVRSMKHRTQIALDALYVAFESFDNAGSFHTDYELLAANIPHEITGQLHVIIERE